MSRWFFSILVVKRKTRNKFRSPPNGKVGVEAAVQALPGLAGHVLVQVLAVHPQHRRHHLLPSTSLSLKLEQLILSCSKDVLGNSSEAAISRKTSSHPSALLFGGGGGGVQMMVVVGGKYFIFPAAAAGRPALALGHHLTLLPRGPAAEQTVGAGSQRTSTSTRPPPPPLYTLLISALGRRQTPQLMPPPHESRLLQQGGESRSAHPDSRQVNARPSSSPELPQTAPSDR